MSKNLKHTLRRLVIALVVGASGTGAFAQDPSPITVTPAVHREDGVSTLSLSFQIPEHHHLYADELSVQVAGQTAHLVLPAPVQKLDRYSGERRGMFVQDFVAILPLKNVSGDVVPLAVNLHGCSEIECYFPETRTWRIDPGQAIVSSDQPALPTAPNEVDPLMTGFRVSQRASGFLDGKEFLTFLDKGTAGTSARADSSSAFAGLGALATIGLILVGGLALNLTPCVLPMIPINLAILGAGVNGGNRRRGFALGGAYGAGMALAYGGLGLLVVLTGSRFGTLNSSPWFNFAIAIVFSVLGLALFDKIAIDLSRFQRTGGNAKTGSAAYVGATTMGAVSALLAGACVAPVVIGVLLLATTSYQNGNLLGLLFPFVLGLGMALPWPFAASGLSFLPKPGLWMTRVKYGFGFLIFGFAAWYGWLGLNLVGWGGNQRVFARESGDDLQLLRASLEESRETGKPVLVDFWASWCKNCSAMEHTTLRNEEVRQRMDDFLVVRFQAERLDDARTKPVLDEFGVMGLPSFVVLQPEYPTGASAVPPTSATN
jgi:thiol:disulfide interchange protein